MRHASQAQCHFNPGQRTDQAQIVQVPEMPDPKNASSHFRQAHAERNIEMIKRHLPQIVSIMGFSARIRGHEDRSQNRAVKPGILTKDLQTPTVDRSAGGAGMPFVAGENLRQALGFQHLNDFGKTKEQIGRRRRRPVPAHIGCENLIPGPVGAWQPGRL